MLYLQELIAIVRVGLFLVVASGVLFFCCTAFASCSCVVAVLRHLDVHLDVRVDVAPATCCLLFLAFLATTLVLETACVAMQKRGSGSFCSMGLFFH